MSRRAVVKAPSSRPPFAVYSSAQYGRQIQGVPCPCWTGRGASQARTAALDAVYLMGGVAVVIGPGGYREEITRPTVQSTAP